VLSGTLDEFALADVFRLLSMAHKTGRLEVERQAGNGAIYFNNGEVYYAQSSLVREQLGQKLVRSGRVTEGQLRRALDEHATTGRRVGEILVTSGAISSEELQETVRGQIEDAVFDLLRWERGNFSWTSGEEIDVEVPISVSVENLIMEASRRLDELEVIARKIPSEDTIVSMSSKPPEGAVEINITPEEWRVLVMVNGSRTVADVADAVGLDRFSTMRTMHGLVSAGLIEVISSAEGGDVDEQQGFSAQDRTRNVASSEHVTGTVPGEPAGVGEPDVVHRVLSPAVGGSSVANGEPPAEDLTASASTIPEEPVAPRARPDLFAGREEEPADLVPPAAGPAPGPPPERWFDDPEPAAPFSVEDAGVSEADAPTEEAATEAADDSGVTEPEAPRAYDVLSAPPAAMPRSEAAARHPSSTGPQPPPPPGASRPPDAASGSGGEPGGAEPGEGASERSPKLDRTAVVRELAGLFNEGEGQPGRAAPASRQGGEERDDRKRVEDDDQVTRGLISRLIDGVKGL
jgi:hypothetical protein